VSPCAGGIDLPTSASLRPVLVALLELVVAPALVGAATLAARRWGEGIGGLVSAFPAIVGPVLLIAAHEHGSAFAAKTASGTLLGLVALSGFALAYGRTALRAGWRTSLAAGWATAAAVAVLLGAVEVGPLAGLAAATLSLLVARSALPRGGAARATTTPPPPAPRWDLALRMILTAVLVVSLAAAASRLGPVVGGMLAALPVLASILAVFTHEQHGAEALVFLLRGMLSGMAGFVVFCALVAVLVDRAGVGPTFAAAALAAVCVQAATALAASRSALPGSA
jgi:hypothetical protein